MDFREETFIVLRYCRGGVHDYRVDIWCDWEREGKGMKNLSVMSEKLLELVKRGESEEVEFKKSTAQLERALKSVCSFLKKEKVGVD